MKTELFIAAIIAALTSAMFALPPDAEALKAKRDAKIAEINSVYAAELVKLQKKAMAAGSLTAANEIAEELAKVSPEPVAKPKPTKPRLDGSWLVGGKIVRRFDGDKLIDESGGKHPWTFIEPNTVRIEWPDGSYGILTYDPKNPDTMPCFKNGARSVYERIK